jgi:methionine synthase I (cobalamin-dependent)
MLDLKTFAKKVRLTDGAWGTQLQLRGLPPGLAPEAWNTQQPAQVEAVGAAYVQAGSEIILTNTFGGNRFALAGHGLAANTADLVERGAAASRRAAAGKAMVFGSIGPTGKIVMMNEVPEEQLELAFAEAATALAHGGVDAIVLETFNELDELEIALRAVKEATQLPVVASMTFASGPQQTATMMGNTPADLAHLAQELGADAVGANCGHGPEGYIRVAELLRAATSLPVWIKPNAGLPQVAADGTTTFPMGPAEFAGFAARLVAAGANFLGGCCGSTPRHISALRNAIDEL